MLLRETIVVEGYTGPGQRGPKYGTPDAIRALVQPTTKLGTDSSGRVVTIDALLIIRPEDGPLEIQSRVTWAGQTFRVVSLFAMPDTRRPSFWQIELMRLEH